MSAEMGINRSRNQIEIECGPTYLWFVLREINSTQHGHYDRRCLSCPLLGMSDHVCRAAVYLLAKSRRLLNYWENLIDTHGFDRSKGNARSWILEGFVKPIA